MPVHKRSRGLTPIEKLDKNFATGPMADDLVWRDAFDRRLALRGLGWPKENRKARNFRRLPDRAEKGLSQGVRALSHCPAGVFLSFFSDATELAARLTYEDVLPMNHMPATGMFGAELYIRDGLAWLPAGTARPSGEALIMTMPLWRASTSHLREFRLYLPLYKKVLSVEVGFSRGSNVKPSPTPPGSRPLFFYGTSITQGGCASTTGSDYVSMVGRLLDTEVINFGFSGNGRGEPEVARLIREVDAEMFVLDFLSNADEHTLPPVLTEFIRLLREKHPTTPIAILPKPAFNACLWDDAVYATHESKRNTAMRVYLAGRDAGDRNLHLLDGAGLLPTGLSGAFVDGVHPTSLGFSIMAERLVPQLRNILLRTRGAGGKS